MGFGFRKRVGLLGGLVRLNLSRGGVSVSAGPKGASVNVDLSGRRKHPRATLSIPGTGMSYATDIKSPAPALSPAIFDRLTPHQRLLVAIKDRSLPLRERAMAFRDVLRDTGDETMVGTKALAQCADQVLRGDGAPFAHRLRTHVSFVIELGHERGQPDVDKYSVETLMEALCDDFAEDVARNDAIGEPLDTSPIGAMMEQAK